MASHQVRSVKVFRLYKHDSAHDQIAYIDTAFNKLPNGADVFIL